MSSSGSEPEPRTEAIGEGIVLALKLPASAREEPESALPAISVAGIPGASIVLRRGFVGDGGVTLRAACVKAPSDRWAPGVEELVLGRATGIARAAIPGEVTRWDAGAIQSINGRFDQRIEGEARASSGAPPGVASGSLKARGRHVLGFVGEPHDALLCSIVCTEPAPTTAAASSRDACASLIDASSPEGAFTGAPPPSALIRLILFAAERPREAGVLGALLALLVVAVVLAKRPWPRP